MIIYGSRATLVAKETIPDPCLHCQSNNTVDIYVFQRYAHIFGIPFFPAGKTGTSQCSHCRKVLKSKEMPASLQTAYTSVAARKRAPLWTFAGTAIAAILIIGGLVRSGRHDVRVSQLLKRPKVGDILEVKKSAGEYTLYKIAEVQADSVAVLPSLESVERESGLGKLESAKYARFSTEPTMYSRENLSVLAHAGKIIDVIRK
jgi:hypothetical protein